MRILALSDPHVDFSPAQKRQWLAQDPGRIDMLVVAGDVANDPQSCEEFLESMGRLGVPMYAVPGNHDEWWGRHAFRRDSTATFHKLAWKHGWSCPSPDQPYEVIDDILLFNLRYHTGLAYLDEVETNDRRYMPLKKFVSQMRPVGGRPVRFSVSHMVPNTTLPSPYPNRSLMFYNPDLDLVLRAHESKLHFFGHSHSWLDHVQDGVRYVNHCVGYEAPPPVLRPLSTYVLEVP